VHVVVLSIACCRLLLDELVEGFTGKVYCEEIHGIVPVAHDVGDNPLDGIDIPEFLSVYSISEHDVMIIQFEGAKLG
jgi:hypothetical protein